jgi:hypothetical protein
MNYDNLTVDIMEYHPPVSGEPYRITHSIHLNGTESVEYDPLTHQEVCITPVYYARPCISETTLFEYYIASGPWLWRGCFVPAKVTWFSVKQQDYSWTRLLMGFQQCFD